MSWIDGRDDDDAFMKKAWMDVDLDLDVEVSWAIPESLASLAHMIVPILMILLCIS